MRCSTHNSILALTLIAACSPENGLWGKDQPEQVECGFNAEPDGDYGCMCSEWYEWCEDDTDDCCAYGTNSFDIRMISAVVSPYKDEGDLQPWDWDGDVPDWLIDALELLADFYPQAQTAAEVANLVDQYAPELLEHTVPPDPYVEGYYGNQEEPGYEIGTWDNTYTPVWNRWWETTLSTNTHLTVWVIDEDLAFDDEIEGFYFDLATLQWAAGRGELQVLHFGHLFELRFEVEPIW